jgi:hypothetical protein
MINAADWHVARIISRNNCIARNRKNGFIIFLSHKIFVKKDPDLLKALEPAVRSS